MLPQNLPVYMRTHPEHGSLYCHRHEHFKPHMLCTCSFWILGCVKYRNYSDSKALRSMKLKGCWQKTLSKDKHEYCLTWKSCTDETVTWAMNQALPALPDSLQTWRKDGVFKLYTLSRTRKAPTTGPNMWNQNLKHHGAFGSGIIGIIDLCQTFMGHLGKLQFSSH